MTVIQTLKQNKENGVKTMEQDNKQCEKEKQNTFVKNKIRL